MITIDRASMNDYQALLKMLGNAFKDKKTGEPTNFATLLPKLYESGVDTMEHHYILKDDDEIKANVAAIPLAMNIMGTKLKVAGIGMVSVSEDARKNGYMRLLMKQALDDVKEQKYDFGVLGGNRQRYEYFGFTPAGVCMEFGLEDINFPHLLGRDKPVKYTFREMVTQDVTLGKSQRLHGAKSAYALRSSENFYRTLKTWRCTPVAIYNKDEFMGYMVTASDGYVIREIELYENETLGEILYDYYYTQTKKEKDLKVVNVFPYECEKIEYLSRSAEYFHAESTCNIAIYNFMSTMQAFANLKTSYTKVADGNFVVEIKGAQKLKVICKNNVVSIIPTLDKADFSMDYLTAVQVIFSPASNYSDFGVELTATARALFPLPLFYPEVDNV